MKTTTEPNSKLWWAVDILCAAEAREAIEYALMEAAALGTETNETGAQLTVTGYFAVSPDQESIRQAIDEALRIYDLPAFITNALQVREVVDRDWIAEWKKEWQPVEVGRIIIAPPWSDVRAARDRVIIRIEPGMAFGTGTHETTRLCLKAVMRFFKGGSFLDVGTGTGILAIAAAKLFPSARVVACDTDAMAVEIAAENARLNEVAGQIEFRVGSMEDLALETTAQSSLASADFVCANLTADVISTLLPSLIGASCGRLVLSGILDTQLDAIVDQLQQSGATGNLVMMQDGEWMALVV